MCVQCVSPGTQPGHSYIDKSEEEKPPNTPQRFQVSAIKGSEDGTVSILVDPEAKFRKYTTCFDGPDWTIKLIRKGGERRKKVLKANEKTV